MVAPLLAALAAGTLASPVAASPVAAAPAAGCSPQVRTTGFHEHLVNADVAPSAAIPPGVATVPVWSGSFTTDGVHFPYTMVGTDPADGSATTTVPVLVVPLRLQFPSEHCVQDHEAMAADITASPLFTPTPFRTGSTQYGDAFQRGNFWPQISSTSPDYHVLLGQPDVLPAVTLQVPPSQGLTVFDPSTDRNVAVVGGKWLQIQIQQLLHSLHIAPSTLAVFVDYNTYATDQNPQDCLTPAGCSFFYAYHGAALSDPLPHAINTYIYASFLDYGDALPAQYDAHEAGLSHEVVEWMDDPFVHGGRVQGEPTFFANTVPAWRSPYYGAGALCGSVLEAADPLEGDGTVFGAPTIAARPTGSGQVFLLADTAFLSWFARQEPSTAVDGLYDLAGVFRTFSRPC